MNTSKQFEKNAKKLWEAPWPIDGLETLNNCPICGDVRRECFFSGLVDNTFFCAPGEWTLWSCKACGGAYLDPRPSPKTIGLAYKNYYTHGQEAVLQESYEKMSLFRKIRRRLVNGYTNWRFGTNKKDANRWGVILAFLIPFVRSSIDNKYRDLPKRQKKELVLLDLGCGDGTFLQTARDCGWRVVGLDPDPEAVKEVQQRGFEVHHGGIEVFEGEEDVFDYICMSHVIEHLHNPNDILKDCRRILKPGGTLWIETPNINSFGCTFFGKNWRGIEAPRHLVIQTSKSLVFLLQASGFREIKWLGNKNVYLAIFKRSYAMSKSVSSKKSIPLPFKLYYQAYLAKYFGVFFVDRREFLTLVARKPKS